MLEKKRILITGANGGIGSSISEKLLKNNGNLVLLYHKNRTQIDKLLSKNLDLKDSSEIYQVDLFDENQLAKILTEILNPGKIDIFIHSVSLPLEHKPVTDITWKDFQSNIELQTKSFLQIVKSLIPSLKESKPGKIICILSSATVGKPPTKMSHYIVGKYSLLGLVKSLSVELANYGITVNCISPSMTDTPLIDKFPTKLKEISSNQNPLGRLVKPDEIASAVLFLCSKNSDFISGENLLITGAETMH